MAGSLDKIWPPVDQQNLLTFLDDNDGEVHTMPSITDPTFVRGQDIQAPFSDWFSRPLRIESIPWSEGSNIAVQLNPWHLYFSNDEVYSKIKGFSRLRCKLHIKLMVNASPFQYGLGVMSYRPLTGDGTINPYSGGSLHSYFTPNNSDANLMSYTQMPHAHFEPQYSKGCQMELPFIYHSDWIELGTPIDGVRLPMLQEMGCLSIVSYDVLRTAGTTSANPISVSLYAWATDVELAGPSMVLQSKDEYSVKPVSSTAHAVAAAAGKLESIPSIAPFARATGTMATALGNLASAFGFSNPPVIDPVHGVKINYASNLASTDIPTQVEKLSLDPKNELTVDARTVGLDGVDHMSIKHIMDRDTYFTSFMWNAPDVPDASLFSMFVNPTIMQVSQFNGAKTNATVRQMQMVPSAFISTMFNHWRGPITIKFVAAASQFHRGRLRVSYDPAGPWGSSNTGSMRLYQKVWDLSVSNTFEYTIPYMAASAWLHTHKIALEASSATEAQFWEDRVPYPSATYLPYIFNGALRVDVLNELTAPTAVNVPIFVFINASEVEFANPVTGNSRSQLSLSILQSADVVTVSDEVTTAEIVTVDNTDHSLEVYMGEKVVSLRNLIHRSSFWHTIKPDFVGAPPNATFNVSAGLADKTMVRWVIPRLPMSYCTRYSNATDTGTVNGYPPWSMWWADYPSSTRFVYGCSARTSPLSLIVACYAGWRGSMVWRAFVEDIPDYSNDPSTTKPRLSSLKITRGQRGTEDVRPNDTSLFPLSPAASKFHTASGGGVIAVDGRASATLPYLDYLKHKAINGETINNTSRAGFGGYALSTPNHVPTVDSVLPHYSTFRMLSSNPDYYFPFNCTDGSIASAGEVEDWDVYWRAHFQQDAPDTFTLDGVYEFPPVTAASGVYTSRDLESAPSISLYHSAGVDFTAFMFLAVPTLWMYVNSPSLVYPKLINSD